MSYKENNIIAQRVMQNEQEFLISVVDVRTLKRYTKYTELLIVGFDEENMPIYNGEVQRKADNAKVNSIADYLIKDANAMFPTNIVLGVPSVVIDDFVEEGNTISIKLNPKVELGFESVNGDVYISVIDGQHRLRGLEVAIQRLQKLVEDNNLFPTSEALEAKLKLNDLLNFQVAITFFINPVLEYQAGIFAIINRTQTKVSESLVYSLFGITDKSSPQKTALNVSLSLNNFKSSPFFNKIKLVGRNYDKGETPVLTQAAFVKAIIRCISPSLRGAELDRFLPRKALLKGINPELCFRRMYAEDRDVDISKTIFAFFKATQRVFVVSGESLWNSENIDNILNTTVGFEVLISLMKIVIGKGLVQNVFSISEYEAILSRAVGKIDFTDMMKYRKTSTTKAMLLSDLRTATGI